MNEKKYSPISLRRRCPLEAGVMHVAMSRCLELVYCTRSLMPDMECLSDKCWLSRGYAAVALSNTVRISHNGELDCIRNDRSARGRCVACIGTES